MQLFDLNIPYLESDNSIADRSSKKQNRLKLTVKAMEFGYSGIAYNRTIKGVMSESDRCSISPFPLSSLLNISPTLSSTVSLHRRLLGVPQNAAFRQYTRLTMLLETSTQASALNSANTILKTYDFIAVRPLNQNSFDIACQSSQIDLISIDFADKLPFRLKLPMIKAAIARGVYFEIMYSSLIMQDVQLRRQTISNAKLLVAWTQGKNLIVSSAAPSALELRGPNDAANLLSLLGLSNECAKATISKNCRLLISTALRKKQFHREAIRVEVMPPGTQTDPKEPWIVPYDWDPLSSGEGDLLLDDMAKAFAESGKDSHVVKGNVSSIVDHVQSRGLQVNDVGFRTQGKLEMPSNFVDILNSRDLEVSKKIEKLQNKPTSLCSSLSDQHSDVVKDSHQAVLPNSPMACVDVEDFKISLQEKSCDALETTTSPLCLHELELLDHARIADTVLFSDGTKEITSIDGGLDVGYIAASRKEVLMKSEGLDGDDAQIDNLKLASGISNSTSAGISTEMQLCNQSDSSLIPDISLSRNLLKLKEDPIPAKDPSLLERNVMDLDSAIERNSSDGLLLGVRKSPEEVVEIQEQKEYHTAVKTDTKDSIVTDNIMLLDPRQQKKDGNEPLFANSKFSFDMMDYRKQVQETGGAGYRSLSENKSGNYKAKRRNIGQVSRIPFKRLLNARFKKKGRTSVYKANKRGHVGCGSMSI